MPWGATSRGLAACLLASACGSSTGADIRITAPSGVTRVEVFVGNTCKPGEQVETCDTAVAWDLSNTKVAGDIYILDIDTITEADKLDDTHFRIQLKAAEMPRVVDRMVFLGYVPLVGTTEQIRAAARLKGVELDTTSGEEWQIELTPVEEIPPSPDPQTPLPAQDGDRVHVWNRSQGALARCLVMERWRSGQVAREFLVPPGDTDCDDVVNECDPYWWNAPAPTVTPDDLSCVTSDHAPAINANLNLGTTCVFGGKTCSERAASVCDPAVPFFCTGSSICANATCRGNLDACIEAFQVAMIKCTLPATDSGVPCGTADVIPFDFTALIEGSSRTCSGLPKFSPISANPAFDTPTTLGAFTLTPIITSGSEPCRPRVTWSGSVGAENTIHAFAAVPLSNGTFAVPAIKLDFVKGGCGTVQPACGVNIDSLDDVRDCAYIP